MRFPSFIGRCLVSRISFAVCLGAALLLPAAASAQTCTVTSTVDSATAGATPGTLRYCAQVALANKTIDLSTLPPLSVITLVQALAIQAPFGLTLHGPANGGVTIAGGSTTRSITLYDGVGSSASFDHLVLQNVAISATEDLTLTDVTSFGITSSAPAVRDTDTLTVTNSTITGNAGGGIAANSGLNLTRSTVYGNASFDIQASTLTIVSQGIVGIISGTAPTTTNSYVGTAAQLGPLQLNGSLFPTMLPQVGSPAIGIAGATTADERGFPGKSTGDAGAVQTHYITVTTADTTAGAGGDLLPTDTTSGNCTEGSATASCTLREAVNYANAQTGTDIIFAPSLTVNASTAAPATITLGAALPNVASVLDMAGPGANLLQISGAGAYQIATIAQTTGALAFNGLTATRGYTAIRGGAFYNAGTLTLETSAVTASLADMQGGGGIFDDNTSSVFYGHNSTISGNSAFNGGGFFHQGIAEVLADSTLSGNTAANVGGGAVVDATANGAAQNPANGTFPPGVCRLVGVTVANNTSNGSSLVGGGGIFVLNGIPEIANSVIEGNTSVNDPDLDVDSSGNGYTDDGGNLINLSRSATSTPGLGPLAYNGGTTKTMLPLPGSPAICAGSAANGQAYGTTTDERGTTHSTAYCRTTELDAGAVQTSYSALAFVQQPQNTIEYSTLNPAPTLALTEDGINAGNVPLTVAATGPNTLAGKTTATTAPGGLASFSYLDFNPFVVDTSETLNSSITVTPTGYSGTESILSSGNSTSFEITGGGDASRSSLVLSPPATAVGGISTATLTLEDSGGFIIPGRVVGIQNSDATVATVPSQVTTNANGVATFTVNGTSPGSSNISARLSSGSISALLLVTGPPSAATSTLSAKPSLLDVGSTSTVTATVEDAAGNPIPNAAVSVSFTSASAPITVTQGGMTNQSAAGQAGSFGGTTNASGQVVYSLTSAAPTKVTMTGTASNSAGNLSFAQMPVVTFAQPSYIVTVATDDATGVPANCTDQATNPTGTNTNCSLRDAIAAANAVAGVTSAITFAPALTATATNGAPTVITLSGAQLELSSGATITGPGSNLLQVSGGNGRRILIVDAGISASLSGLSLTKGSSNTASESGGAAISNNGALTLTRMAFMANASVTYSADCFGGAIRSVAGSLTVTQSTFSGNSCFESYSTSSSGGAIAATGGTLSVTDSTFSGNSVTTSASNPGSGGAIFTTVGGTLASVTINGNSSDGGGAGLAATGTPPTVTNTLISGNTGANDVSGAYINGGGNLVGATAASVALAPLAYYGGPTQTLLPLPGSVAICAGSSTANALVTDQRGAARTTPYASTTCVDAGAVQTHYALAFAMQPSNVPANVSMSPAPKVSLSENGVPFTSASEALPLTLSGNGNLSGGTASTTTTGVATYNGLQVSAAGTGDTLTANLVLNTSPATMIAATSNTFNVAAQAPTVLSIVPSSGPATGGTTVTISGSNFTSGSTTVQFGSTSATSVTYVNPTTLTAVSPARLPGTVNVTVTTPAGTTTLSAAFTYVGPTAYLVTTLTDDATGMATNCLPAATSNTGLNNNCSLRDAIAAANALPGGVPATINFYSPLFTSATRTSPAVYSMGASGTLNVTSAVTINGPTGSDAGGIFNELAIDGTGGNGSSGGIFFLNSASHSVALNQLIVSNGKAMDGGGIFISTGMVTITGSTLIDNTVIGLGGGIRVEPGGTLTLNGSTISGNSSVGDGGGIFTFNGTLNVNDSTISGNSASNSFGGGLYISSANATFSGSTISGNTAKNATGIGVVESNGYIVMSSNTLLTDSTNGLPLPSGQGNVTTTGAASLSPLGYFGGPTQTILPLPGSPALCGGITSLATGSPTSNQSVTDQRNAIHSVAYCTASQLDSGAVQTSYSLGSGFTTNPPSTVSPGSAMTPAPAVTVTENTQAASGDAVALSAADGTLSGTTTVSSGTNGVATFNGVSITGSSPGDTLTATLNLGPTAGAPQVAVTSTAFSATSLTPGTLPRGTVGIAYTQTLSVNGGSGTYTYSISQGALPAGLTLGAGTGVISGTPTAGGSFPFTVSAGNGSGNAATHSYTLTIAGATVTLMPATLPSFTVGMQASVTFTAAGGTAPYTYSSTGMLPSGLTLNASTGVLSGSPTAGGTYTFTFTAKDSSAGTGPYSGSLSYTAGVDKALPAVSIAAANTVYGAQSATLSATVTFAGSVAPSGAFSFAVGTGSAVTAQCTLNNGSSTSATCTTSYPTRNLAAGTFMITGTQSADANYNAASSTNTLTVTQATPAITVANQTVAYGMSNTTLSAMVAYSGGVPSGGVSFTVDGGTSVVAACNASASPETCTATYPTAGLAAGTHTITAIVAADANDTTATATGLLTISAATPTIIFTVPNHAYGDAPFAVSATSNSTGTLTYTVVSGSATVSGNVVSLTGIGTVVLQASEAADRNYMAGSQQTSFMVAPTPLNVSANNATRFYGAANPAFTGTVTGQRYNDTFTESFMTNPAATPTSAPGAYSIVPAAAGTDLGDYSVTTVNGLLTITQAPTVATLTASATTLNPNQPVTLTATIASTTSGVPTGSVTFYNNGTPLGTAPLGTPPLGKGTATYTATLSPASSNSLTVSYTGDVDFLESSSAGTVTVSVAPLSFTFTDTGAPALTEAPGKVAVYTFQLAPDFGSYASTVTFSVTGLPPGATASFTPNSVAAGGGVQTVVMSVQTARAFAREQVPAGPFGPRQLPLLALLLLPFLSKRETRRRLGSRLLMLMLLAGGLAGVACMTGCGSSNGFLLEQPATYTLTVTATAGPLQQSQTVTLEVQ